MAVFNITSGVRRIIDAIIIAGCVSAVFSICAITSEPFRPYGLAALAILIAATASNVAFHTAFTDAVTVFVFVRGDSAAVSALVDFPPTVVSGPHLEPRDIMLRALSLDWQLLAVHQGVDGLRNLLFGLDDIELSLRRSGVELDTYSMSPDDDVFYDVQDPAVGLFVNASLRGETDLTIVRTIGTNRMTFEPNHPLHEMVMVAFIRYFRRSQEVPPLQ